jgi:hypothetical protein
MFEKSIPVFILVFYWMSACAQHKVDTSVMIGQKMITLSEVVVNNKLNIPSFIERVKDDTTFYKAFRNLHILGFTSLNDIRMLDKKNETEASLYSKTKQLVQNGCRKMQIIEQQTTGDMYDADSNFNYYTAQLYASLFFTKDPVCGEDNIVDGRTFSTENKSGLEKHKEQLKMLFFNPGKKIPGIPFLSGKTSIFDDNMSDDYDMSIDMDEYNKTSCYIFTIKVKPGKENDVVVDSMTTWFDDKTYEIVARKYVLSYDAGIYDFNVQMEVQMTHFNGYLVPSLLRYTGNWKVLFKSRERGVFTATLFDFTN